MLPHESKKIVKDSERTMNNKREITLVQNFNTFLCDNICTREIAPDPELTMYRPNNSNIRSKKTRTRESTKSERDFLKSPDLSCSLKLANAQCAYTAG